MANDDGYRGIHMDYQKGHYPIYMTKRNKKCFLTDKKVAIRRQFVENLMKNRVLLTIYVVREIA